LLVLQDNDQFPRDDNEVPDCKWTAQQYEINGASDAASGDGGAAEGANSDAAVGETELTRWLDDQLRARVLSSNGGSSGDDDDALPPRGVKITEGGVVVGDDGSTFHSLKLTGLVSVGAVTCRRCALTTQTPRAFVDGRYFEYVHALPPVFWQCGAAAAAATATAAAAAAVAFPGDAALLAVSTNAAVIAAAALPNECFDVDTTIMDAVNGRCFKESTCYTLLLLTLRAHEYNTIDINLQLRLLNSARRALRQSWRHCRRLDRRVFAAPFCRRLRRRRRFAGSNAAAVL
jgi:hypothetical protein